MLRGIDLRGGKPGQGTSTPKPRFPPIPPGRHFALAYQGKVELVNSAGNTRKTFEYIDPPCSPIRASSSPSTPTDLGWHPAS